MYLRSKHIIKIADSTGAKVTIWISKETRHTLVETTKALSSCQTPTASLWTEWI